MFPLSAFDVGRWMFGVRRLLGAELLLSARKTGTQGGVEDAHAHDLAVRCARHVLIWFGHLSSLFA